VWVPRMPSGPLSWTYPRSGALIYLHRLRPCAPADPGVRKKLVIEVVVLGDARCHGCSVVTPCRSPWVSVETCRTAAQATA
jgi:hypothetical protein